MTKKIPSPLITPSPLISACYLRATIPVLDALQSTMQKKGAQKQKHIRRDFQKKRGAREPTPYQIKPTKYRIQILYTITVYNKTAFHLLSLHQFALTDRFLIFFNQPPFSPKTTKPAEAG
ncbi:TPA: hypothetical protein HMV90_21480 [Escherichia coli]|nr:hypothetical protein [Escherichia coli]